MIEGRCQTEKNFTIILMNISSIHESKTNDSFAQEENFRLRPFTAGISCSFVKWKLARENLKVSS